ncbi:MAG: glycosyltransferase family 2 protein [Blastocatellia bacterium]
MNSEESEMNSELSIVCRLPVGDFENLSIADAAPESDIVRELVDRSSVSLIIPALNEEKSIGSVLRTVPRHLVGEIIVADNGSTDGTVELARREGANVVVENSRGYGAACLAGLSALSENCEIVAFIDADYSDFPEDLRLILKPILDGRAEMVIGTRTALRESRKSLTPQQRYGNWLATRLVKLFFGRTYSDLGPFRAIRRDVLEKLKMSDRNFGWTIEMQIKAAQQKLKIVEVPVRYRVRIGRSKISGTVKGTVLAGTKIIYTIFKYALKSE